MAAAAGVGALRVLFVCSRNQWRSPTAEALWRRHPALAVRSAGTSARRRLGEADLAWADVILMMAPGHKRRILAEHAERVRDTPIHVLDIRTTTATWTPNGWRCWRCPSQPAWGFDFFKEKGVGFSSNEREALLALKGVGPTVVQRLEQLGFHSLEALAAAEASDVVGQAAALLGSSCWKNSPQARAAIQAAIDMARAR